MNDLENAVARSLAKRDGYDVEALIDGRYDNDPQTFGAFLDDARAVIAFIYEAASKWPTPEMCEAWRTTDPPDFGVEPTPSPDVGNYRGAFEPWTQNQEALADWRAMLQASPLNPKKEG